MKILTEKLTIFSNQLSKCLSRTKEFKLKKLLKEIPISPPEIAHTNNTWIENLDLTENKGIILSNQDLHDGIIGAAINLIQGQFPILVIQSPSLYFASGFEYCPYETIQIIHNNVHHWILLSSFNGEVKIFDSLNTDPTIEISTNKTASLSRQRVSTVPNITISQTSWNHRLRCFCNCIFN